jgi:hypothetical protein
MNIEYYVTATDLVRVLHQRECCIRLWSDSEAMRAVQFDREDGTATLVCTPSHQLRLPPSVAEYRLDAAGGFTVEGATFEVFYKPGTVLTLTAVARKVKTYKFVVTGVIEGDRDRFSEVYYAENVTEAEETALEDHPDLLIAATYRVFEADDDDLAEDFREAVAQCTGNFLQNCPAVVQQAS